MSVGEGAQSTLRSAADLDTGELRVTGVTAADSGRSRRAAVGIWRAVLDGDTIRVVFV